MTLSLECPHCKHKFDLKPRRVCFDCGKAMGKHDKYTYEIRNGIMTMVHRHCDNPRSYNAKEEADEGNI